MNLRQDLEVVQYPSPLPNFGGLIGANTQQVDQDFGTRILRLTDASVYSNRTMQTSDAAQAGLWNADDTLILATATGGKKFLYQFDPVGFKATLLPFTTSDQSCFSRVDPSILYRINGASLVRDTFTKTNGTWVHVKTDTLYVFSKLLPTGFQIKSSSVFSVSFDDSTFAIGFSNGIQGTGIYVCVWNKSKGGRVLNLNTGSISGQWGSVGTASISSPNYKLPMTFHEVYMAMNPNYVIVNPVGSSNTSLVWDVNTLNLVDGQQTGHKAYGMLGTFSGGPGGGQLAYGLYTSPATHTMVVRPENLPVAVGQKYHEDMHLGVGKVDPNDASFIFSTSSANGAMPFVSAWENEVKAYDPKAGVVYRVCHTFDSNQSKQFVVLNAIGAASQTGKYVAFASDMMGSLGSTSGAPKGTLGDDARGDVFIVEV